MYARVATFEGGSAEGIRAAMQEIRRQAEEAGGPPEGVDSVGFTLIGDPDGGRVMGIGLFETREALEASEPVLDAMSPPNDGFGRRVSVDVFEVGLDVRV